VAGVKHIVSIDGPQDLKHLLSEMGIHVGCSVHIICKNVWKIDGCTIAHRLSGVNIELEDYTPS